MKIHPSAIVDPAAELGEAVEVAPYAMIEGDVTIGAGCVIGPHAVIHRYTTLGEGCQLGVGVVLGGLPQDSKYQGERSFLRIGSNNIIREYVTLHRASGEDNATTVGDDNFIMAYAHAGHNATIGSNCLIASYVGISGYVAIEDKVNIGGLTGIHQYVTIGELSMLAGVSGATRDIPPFTISEGRPARPRGINVIGLRRNGISRESVEALRAAFKVMYASGLNIGEAIARVEDEITQTPELRTFLEFHRRRDEGSRGRREQR